MHHPLQTSAGCLPAALQYVGRSSIQFRAVVYLSSWIAVLDYDVTLMHLPY